MNRRHYACNMWLSATKRIAIIFCTGTFRKKPVSWNMKQPTSNKMKVPTQNKGVQDITPMIQGSSLVNSDLEDWARLAIQLSERQKLPHVTFRHPSGTIITIKRG